MRAMRLLAVVIACGVLVSGSESAVAASDQSADGDYLALGDSVAFGYNPLLNRGKADNFVGYPEALARRVDFDLTNAACPGETSDGLISHADPQRDNGCIPYRAAKYPLHVKYTTSQLDFAVTYLMAHRNTRLVTISVGANDLFLLLGRCNRDPSCVANGMPALTQRLGANLATIYGRIRGEAHYAGPLVALTYYTVDYRDQSAVQAIRAVNIAVTAATLAAQGRVADGFDAFRLIAGLAGGDSSEPDS